jgi:plasmid stabilization system protein ParE
VAKTLDIQPRAIADIRRTVGWLSHQVSPGSAARWHARILAAIQTLVNDPTRCPQADEAEDLGLDLRELLHGRRPHVYRILFTIDGNTVNIHYVRHAARYRLTEDDV